MTRGQARLACCALGLFLCALPAQAAVFYPESYTLANGLRVVIVKNTLSDAVVQMVWYRAGSLDDAQGKSGTAHYLEHLMFKGTSKVPDGAFSSTIAAMGGQDNAFTSHDSTAYYVTISRENLGQAMLLESDRMRGLVIDPALAQTELAVVRSERQERTDNKPQGLFEEKLRAALFGAHPYGRPVIGWDKDLAQLTAEDARAFYAKHYTPENAILVLSGNIQTQDALALADATFGQIPHTPSPRQPTLPSVAVPQEKSVTLHDARVKQPYWTKRILAPSAKQNPRRAAALEVLSEVLTGGEIGLLYRHFVLDQRTASAIDVSYDSTSRGPAIWAIVATPVRPDEMAMLAKAVEKKLRQLSMQGVREKEIEEAKQRMQDAAIFARDRLMAPAQILGEVLAAGGSLADVEDWPTRINGVTKADVDAALRDLVASRHAVTGQMLPLQGSRP